MTARAAPGGGAAASWRADPTPQPHGDGRAPVPRILLVEGEEMNRDSLARLLPKIEALLAREAPS